MQTQLGSPHAIDLPALLARLGVDGEAGLSSDEAARRLDQDGPNELAHAPGPSRWKRLWSQFNSVVIWILIVAAVIAGALGEWVDTAAIMAIVLLNGLLGFLQEQKAEAALAALEDLSSPMAKVLRDGHLISMPARQLVVGDRLELEAGDRVPADARLATAFGTATQEAALTGESTPVDKDAATTVSAETAVGDRVNMVFQGTVITSGKASAVVTATGMDTELGHIAGMLGQTQREQTPLQRRLEELGRVLVVVCLCLVAVIFVIQILRGGDPLEVLMMSISLAVAAVPEGLPAVVTLALAIGLQRMVRRNALIRKLPGVETLGSVTVICSDKTGTLTRNEMTVRTVIVGDRHYKVSGSGYAPRGEFELEGGPNLQSDDHLRLALEIGAWCNNAELTTNDEGQTWQAIGDPTEAALIAAARKLDIDRSDRHLTKVYELPFDSQRKAMSVVLRRSDGTLVHYAKGAVESLLAKCTHEQGDGKTEPLEDERRRALADVTSELSSHALRVLALAYRATEKAEIRLEDESNLIFVGLVGMIDPPRDEARTAVEMCHAAGIRPVMITGDHPATALAIGRELGIATSTSIAVTGTELDRLSASELGDRARDVAVFARVSARHKLQIVEALKAQQQIVAMTGDGVNDAPAVKTADIGIAMGITGTDVTKEASDMVLTDDNFASIVGAVEEGRGIYENIQKFIHYLLSCNAGEVMFMFFAAAIGWPIPLAAVQVLWMNLVTDGFPALALGMEQPESDIMQRPPRPPREPVITRERGLMLLFHGAMIAIAAAVGFWLVYRGNESNVPAARSAAFGIMALAQLLFSMACRSLSRTLPELGLFTNGYLLAAVAFSGVLQLTIMMLPAAQTVFDVVPLSSRQWLLVICLALAPVTAIEILKLIQSAVGKRAAATA